MKFRDYIKEKDRTILGDPIESKPDIRSRYDKYDTAPEVVQKLKKNCSQIISLYKNNAPLWRGVKKQDDGDPLYKGKGRVVSGRDPKDIPKIVHDYLNKEFKKKFGWPVRNGLPVTTDGQQAAMYGKPLIFFPFNGFNWAFVKGERDIFISLDDKMWDTWGMGHGAKAMTKFDWKDNPKIQNHLDSIVKKATDTPWKKHNGEILFNTSSYYLFDPHVIGFVDTDDGSVDGAEWVLDQLGLWKSIRKDITAVVPLF